MQFMQFCRFCRKWFDVEAFDRPCPNCRQDLS